MANIPFILVIVGVVVMGLWLSNILYDLKVPQYLSRKVGHGAGGMGFLISYFVFKDAYIPIAICALFCISLWISRFVSPSAFRGVGGSGRSDNVMAEVWFPLSGVFVLSIAWLFLKRPELATVSMLYMAWGDCVTGIVRTEVYGKAVKGLWGSVAMLVVCLVLTAALVGASWIGVVASFVATITEWACGDVGVLKKIDDNAAIPVTSLATLLILSYLAGVL